MEKKIVSISSKRQITIPIKFFEALDFGDEAECILKGNELVIRPVTYETNSEFADLILSDLIEEGYAGQSLLLEFRARQKKIRPAVEAMIEDARKIAHADKDYIDYSDIFDFKE